MKRNAFFYKGRYFLLPEGVDDVTALILRQPLSPQVTDEGGEPQHSVKSQMSGLFFFCRMLKRREKYTIMTERRPGRGCLYIYGGTSDEERCLFL